MRATDKYIQKVSKGFLACALCMCMDKGEYNNNVCKPFFGYMCLDSMRVSALSIDILFDVFKWDV